MARRCVQHLDIRCKIACRQRCRVAVQRQLHRHALLGSAAGVGHEPVAVVALLDDQFNDSPPCDSSAAGVPDTVYTDV